MKLIMWFCLVTACDARGCDGREAAPCGLSRTTEGCARVTVGGVITVGCRCVDSGGHR